MSNPTPSMPWRVERHRVRDFDRDLIVYPNGNNQIASEDQRKIWEYVQHLERQASEARELAEAFATLTGRHDELNAENERLRLQLEELNARKKGK